MNDSILTNDENFDAVAKRLTVEKGLHVSKEDVIRALFMVIGDTEDLEWVADIWDMEMGQDEIYTTLKDFDFKLYGKEVETNIDVIGNGVLHGIKQTIKRGGSDLENS